MEARRFTEGVVADRRNLASLLSEENPVGTTRGGGEHPFDREALSRLGDGLPGEVREALKIPILFFVDMDVRDSCYLTDEIALRALQVHGDLGGGRRLSGGRLWVARPIAFAISRKYPTAIQFVLT